jgi:CBS domain-containing protein
MSLGNRVREILVPLSDYPCIGENNTFQDAFRALKEGYADGQRFRHVLVVDDQDELVGILRPRDLLHGLMPDYLLSEELPHHAEGLHPEFAALTMIWADTCEKQCPEAAQRRVKDYMAPVTMTVSADDPLTTAAYLMFTHHFNILPVVDGDRLVGVARITDVFDEVAKAVLHD